MDDQEGSGAPKARPESEEGKDGGKLVLGPSGGTYRERPIPDWIEEGGQRWEFDRTILDAESLDLRELDDDEVVISPGLIYKEVRRG